MNADSPWRDPSSTGPVEGGDLPEKQGWVPKGTRTQTGYQRTPSRGTLLLPTPHHTTLDSLEGRSRVEVGLGRGGGLGWEVPSQITHGSLDGAAVGARLGGKQAMPDPIVRNAPTIPRGIQLATRGRTFHRGQPEGWR